MPAYIRSIEQECQGAGCTKRATVAVYNSKNAKYGEYCKRCGQRALKRLQAMEGS